MMITDIMFQQIKKRIEAISIGSEQILLFLFAIASIYAIVESRNFDGGAATFPRIVSTSLFIGIMVWISRDFLPKGIQSAFTQSSSLADVTDSDTKAIEDENLSTNYATIGLTVGYVILCYFIGFLLASPIFVLAYMLWTRQPWYFVVIMTILAFSIVYLFMWVSGANLDSGLYIKNGVPI